MTVAAAFQTVVDEIKLEMMKIRWLQKKMSSALFPYRHQRLYRLTFCVQRTTRLPTPSTKSNYNIYIYVPQYLCACLQLSENGLHLYYYKIGYNNR